MSRNDPTFQVHLDVLEAAILAEDAEDAAKPDLPAAERDIRTFDGWGGTSVEARPEGTTEG